MGGDFNALYDSGAALWHGRYVGLYPLPLNGLFALLALMPRQVALVALTVAGLALFVAEFRRRALMWIFFQPVLAGLWLGQCDLLFLWLLRHASGVSLALMTLKPQLFPLAIPALLAPSGREKWKSFGLACLGLYGPVTIVRPSWIAEWVQRFNDGRVDYWYGSTSVLAYPLIGAVVLLAAAAAFKLDWRAVFWSCNPSLRWYDFSLMAGGSLWLIPASWVLWVATQALGGNPSPVAWLGLVELVVRKGEEQLDTDKHRFHRFLSVPSLEVPVGDGGGVAVGLLEVGLGKGEVAADHRHG
jgi:hypothetical protein